MSALDDLLARPGLLIAPGAYDGLSAKAAASAGADCVYMTGFGVAGSLLGKPDIGLVTLSEMTDRAAALAEAASPAPLIADGDNGHGGPLNVQRMVAAYERAGAACIQLEDQVLPKRCGHMDGKEVLPCAEAAAKIRAAADARGSTDFKIMARTDARATHDLDEALRRGEAFLEAGADILFIEAPQTEAEMRRVGETFKGVPLVANMVEGGKTPYLGRAELEGLGFKIALFPISTLLVVARQLQETYAELLGGNGLSPATTRLGFAEYNELVGLPGFLAAADSYRGDG